jgi:hypothetical protein
VERYKFENTVGQLHILLIFALKNVVRESTLLLLYFYVNYEKSVCIIEHDGDKSFPAVLYKAKQDALFGEHVRP